MTKLGGRRKNWKRRWFVLTAEALIYYTSDKRTFEKVSDVDVMTECADTISKVWGIATN